MAERTSTSASLAMTTIVTAQGVRRTEKYRLAAGRSLLRRSGSDQEVHHQPKIVPRNVDQVALANVLATTQPSSPHAAPLQSVGEGAFDPLGPPSHGFLADTRAQTDPVGVDGYRPGSPR